MGSGTWHEIQGEIPAPKGFRASGVSSGFKKHGEDLALIVSEREAHCAALFTTNQVKAAPILVSQASLKKSQNNIRAILVNAGCANACTGKKGLEVALASAKLAAKELRVGASQVLPASTGVIGKLLDLEKMKRAIPFAVQSLSPWGLANAARAIMTTDIIPKIYSVKSLVAGREVTIAGIAKGSGMINPSLATMLSFIVTDAAINQKMLEMAFNRCVEKTFNSITVDGDTSTNDMAAIIANGGSGHRMISSESAEYDHFSSGLMKVCDRLARSIVHDGEGATRFVEVTIKQARSYLEAKQIAKAIANSPLVKTAVYGSDVNWGRIICAAGHSGVAFDPDLVDLYINKQCVMKRGAAHNFNLQKVREEFKQPHIQVSLFLHQGKQGASVWTCDLSHEYITINSTYTT
ncbi:MAG: bifunctional glutamate N-acetyltransferase/amino-acid acetyltransferase ArgJ [Acidobacteria bacterium]|nr:bifunctional glutamate N-acetyltransferase/amino-acid acetyltransferase ArgJ [Acidobacteriota bacterium]MBI3655491.1 bifunctional glutamate N-acetyltransferase/amino-acid acetyltransferase ArgJ [Acidobacteriota bacterium]